MCISRGFVSDDILKELNRLEDYIDWSTDFIRPAEYEAAEIALANLISFVCCVSKPETQRILKSNEYAEHVDGLLYDRWGKPPTFKLHTLRGVE